MPYLLDTNHCIYLMNGWNTDEEQRTPEDDEQMIRLSHASHFHWTQRPDYTTTSASIGYWQTSRIYAILDQAENAMRYGNLCLEASQAEGVPPFFLGYAYEALARAAAVSGNRQEMDDYLDKAKDTAKHIEKVDERKMLVDDLQTIKIK